MYVNGFHWAGDLAAETGPAVLGIPDLSLSLLAHLDYIAGTEEGAVTAPHTCLCVDPTNHLFFSFERQAILRLAALFVHAYERFEIV
jgi:hypothetical protein